MHFVPFFSDSTLSDASIQRFDETIRPPAMNAHTYCGPSGLNKWKSHQLAHNYVSFDSNTTTLVVVLLVLLVLLLLPSLVLSVAKIKAEGLSTVSESDLHERSGFRLRIQATFRHSRPVTVR